MFKLMGKIIFTILRNFFFLTGPMFSEKNVRRKQLNILQMRRQMEESRDFENDYMPILMNSVDSVERNAWEWSICIMCSECRDFQQSLKTTVCKRKRRKRPDVKLPRMYTSPCKLLSCYSKTCL